MAEGSQRQCLYLERSGFCAGSACLGDMLTWETIQSGIVQFSPKCDILVYRSIESGALIAYSTEVHQYHDRFLDRDESEGAERTLSVSTRRQESTVCTVAERVPSSTGPAPRTRAYRPRSTCTSRSSSTTPH